MTMPDLMHPWYDLIKTLGNRKMVSRFKKNLALLEKDSSFRAFHEHETEVLPQYYHQAYENSLGPYATLMPREDRKPTLHTIEKRGTRDLCKPVAVARI